MLVTGFSPMINPHMTFIETVAWIAARDSRFADTCRDRTHRRLAVSLAIRKSGGEMQHRSIDSAEKALLAKGRSGKITATGLRGDISGPTAKRRTRITDIEWIDIRGRATEDTRTGRLKLESKADGDFWHELTFTRADVLAEFPVSMEQVQLPGHVDGVDHADQLPDVNQLTNAGPGPEGASIVELVNPMTNGIARVVPKCPPMSQRMRYSLWQGIMDEFPDGVPVTMTVPEVARQLAENRSTISRGIKKKNLKDGKHETSLKRLLERTGKQRPAQY